MSNLLSPIFRQTAYKGENKILYKSDSIGQFILSFDNADAKICMIRNKISQVIFELLSECGIPNHFLKAHGLKEQTVIALEMMPFVVNIHTSTNADIANRLYCQEGMKLKNYLIEFRMKVKDKVYPVISKEHVVNFEWVNQVEAEKIVNMATRIMDVLYGFFRAYDCTVSSISLEFGRMYKDGVAQDILLADEMSPKNISFIPNDMLEVSNEDLYVELAKRFGILKYE